MTHAAAVEMIVAAFKAKTNPAATFAALTEAGATPAQVKKALTAAYKLV